MRAAACALALAFAAPTVTAGQTTLDALLDKVSAYLDAYEPELATLVADETYDQTASVTGGMNAPWSMRRRLESSVAFMRLPGGHAWLGIRSVRTVNRKPVAHEASLQALLSANMTDIRAQAVAIAEASGQYNLGETRTINMPTLALELLNLRHRHRFAFVLGRVATIDGVRTRRVQFIEKERPTLIISGSGNNVLARGEVWIEESTGAVRRAQVLYRSILPPGSRMIAPEGEVKVSFKRHDALGLLVPHEMNEVFGVRSGRGEGRARYSNYRRFSTSGRIIPQDR